MERGPAGTSPGDVGGPPHAEASFDRNRLLQRIGGDGALLSELGELFRRDAPELLGVARAALARRDSAAFAKAAHQLKGMMLTLCADPAASLALAVERASVDGDWSNVESHLPRLEVEVDRLGGALVS